MEQGNINVNARWVMPNKGLMKCNVHAFFSEDPFPNGNRSGIGVVFRNSKGMITWMVAGSLGYENRRNNEYNAFFEGLKEAYFKKYSKLILETDHVDAFWDWQNSTVLGGPAEHEFVLWQLNQRRADRNFMIDVRLADPEANALAAYLARHGAEHWTQMVAINEPFGRIRELWSFDMGLGRVEPRFQVILEEDLDERLLEDEIVNPFQEVQNEMVNGVGEEDVVLGGVPEVGGVQL